MQILASRADELVLVAAFSVPAGERAGGSPGTPPVGTFGIFDLGSVPPSAGVFDATPAQKSCLELSVALPLFGLAHLEPNSFCSSGGEAFWLHWGSA